MTHSPRRTFHLTTFGSLAITEGADASNRSRRALALLALAAAGGPNGTDRAGILALLWPDSDTDRAANSFRQILHGIRRDLGEGAIVYEGGSLKLNPAVFSVDLWDLEHAARSDDMETVAELYRGPFLGTFHLHGLVEFERWVEGHRERLRQVTITALRRLATAARASGDNQGTVRWSRALLEIDPLSSKNALSLLHALAAAGERAGALDFARTYEALVRTELETEVDEEVIDYVALLRRGSGEGAVISTERAPTPPTVSASAGSANDDSVYSTFLYKEGFTHEEPAVQSRGRISFRALMSRSSAQRAAVTAAGVALLTVGATAGRLLNASAKATADASNLVAVMPFHAYDARDSSLTSALAALLSADLDGAGTLRSVPAAAVLKAMHSHSNGADASIDLDEARRVALKAGASLVVTGEIVERDKGLRLSLALRRAHSGELIGQQVVVDSDTERVRQAVDEIAGRLAAGRYSLPRDRLTRAALRSTRTVAAFKFYLAGEDALRRGLYIDAADEFERATVADTTFALAYYRLAGSAEWSGRMTTSRRSTELAIRYSDHLDDRDRRLIVAFAAFRDGRGTVAEHTYRSILDDYPDDTEAWFQLGEVLFHNNPLRGESATEAQPAFERLLTLDPDNLEAIVHLARIASLEQRQADAESLGRRALKLAGEPNALDQRAFRAFALADRPGVRRVSLDLERAAPSKLGRGTLLSIAIDVDDVVGTEQFARVTVEQSTSPASRAYGLRLLAHTAIAQGRWQDARARLNAAMALNKDLGIAQLSLAATMPFVPIERQELERVFAMVREWTPITDTTSDDETIHDGLGPIIRLHRLGVLAVKLGDIDAARRAVTELDGVLSPARARRFAYTLSQSVRARISAQQGHLTEALAALDAADWEGPADVFAAEAADRFFRATLLEALGRSREAAGWYSSVAERAVYELPYLAPAQTRLAGIARANGDSAAAKLHAARADALWRDADAAVRVAFR